MTTVLIGHDHTLAQLDRTAMLGTPAHGYLFVGPEGVGKKTAAVCFASRLNCPIPADDPHGACPVCRRIASGKHPDVIVERPERNRIRVDRIREIREFFRYAPVEGRYRVAIIDDAHLMNHQAQNALLKTLEEPPPGRMLILVSAKPSLLLATVRSRCRKIRFGPVPPGPLEALLCRDTGLSGDMARNVAVLAGGSVGRALELAKSDHSDAGHGLDTFLSDPGAKGLKGILELSAALTGNRQSAVEAVDIAIGLVGDALLDRGAYGDCVPEDPAVDEDGHRSMLRSRRLLAVYDELVRAANLLTADTNINPSLVMDVTLLRIARILGGQSLGIPHPGRT
ncbi:MAG: DNA polymerase III subunit delta' [Pseudomonadota bacterium]